MYFRYAIGIFCLAAGAVFLTINSIILYRGAYKFGHDEIDKIAFGVAASVVPWVIAVMPAAVGDTWRKTFFGLLRPSASTLAMIFAWIAFIAYNLTNGTGVIASSRLETVADREHASDTVAAMKDLRDRLKGQLAGIPQHRPADTVSREIDAAKLVKAYENSKQCADPSSRDQRATCQTISRLEGELAAARSSAKLQVEIAQVDGDLRQHKPVVASADPQTDMLHDVTSIPKDKLRIWLAASTPIILEVGAGLMWHFGFSVLGISLRGQQTIAAPEKAKEADPAPPILMSPERINAAPVASLEALTAQRKLCEWFFRECSRPVSAGAMTEEEWYEHYTAICRRSNDTPLPIESFRRVAMRFVPRMHPVEGQWQYFERLPLIPDNAG